MTALCRALALAILLYAGVTHAAHAQSPFGLNFTGAVSLNVPTGALNKDVSSGIGLMIRSASRRAGNWGIRSGLAFERFSGKAAIDNLQMFTFFGGELLHYTGKYFYQYAGIGVYNTRVAQKDDIVTAGGGSPVTTARRSSSFDFGFQGGIGITIPVNGAAVFLESGMVQVLTSGPATSWVPLRIGLKL